MPLPVITLELHQRTAIDHVRDTETFTLVAYANNELALDRGHGFEYARPIATIEVDRPYIFAGSQQEWRSEVCRAATRKALEMQLPTVWKGKYGDICGKYYGE